MCACRAGHARRECHPTGKWRDHGVAVQEGTAQQGVEEAVCRGVRWDIILLRGSACRGARCRSHRGHRRRAPVSRAKTTDDHWRGQQREGQQQSARRRFPRANSPRTGVPVLRRLALDVRDLGADHRGCHGSAPESEEDKEEEVEEERVVRRTTDSRVCTYSEYIRTTHIHYSACVLLQHSLTPKATRVRTRVLRTLMTDYVRAQCKSNTHTHTHTHTHTYTQVHASCNNKLTREGCSPRVVPDPGGEDTTKEELALPTTPVWAADRGEGRPQYCWLVDYIHTSSTSPIPVPLSVRNYVECT